MNKTCPSSEQLRSLVDGRLDLAAHAALANHLEECTNCQVILEVLTSDTCLQKVQALPSASARPALDLNDTVVARLEQACRAEQPFQGFASQAGAQAAGADALPTGARHDAGMAQAAVTGPPSVPGYDVLRELGRGGMGVVYQARHLKLDRLVALKVILAGGHAGDVARARLRIEAQATARLQHPHIVQVHEVGEHLGLPYLALEYCPGGSLAQKLGGTPLPAKDAAALVEKLARAIHAAHQKNILHRDLKPANVLLAEHGIPKVTDFGLARKLDEASHTATGAMMGTPSYMAPEQAEGKTAAHELTEACDVYALGAILYECLTGRPPFKAATAIDTMRQVIDAEPVRPARLNATVPRDLETICLKCLQKESRRRYATAEMLADDLRRFLHGEPILARPVWRLEKAWRWCGRNRAVASLSFVVALLVVVAIALAWLANVTRLQQLERKDFLQQQQMELHGPHAMGWSEKAWGLGLKAAAIHKDEQVRDQLAASLVGMDARLIQQVRNISASSAAFDPSGEQLFLGGSSGAKDLAPQGARLLAIATGNTLHQSKQAVPGPVAFRGDLPLQLLAEGDHILIWDVAKQRQVSMCRFDPAPGINASKPTASAFAPDGSLAAASATTNDGKAIVAVWDTATGKLVFQRMLAEKATVDVLVFAAGGKLLAAGDDRGTISLWASRPGPQVPTVFAEATSIQCLAFSPNSQRLAVAAKGGRLAIWDLQATRPIPLSFLRGLNHDVRALSFSPNGMMLASADFGDVQLWDVATGSPILSLGAGRVEALAFSADSKRLAAAMPLFRGVHVWELEHARGIQVFYGLNSQISRVCLSPDGKRLAALAHNWQVGVWESSGRLLHLFNVPEGLVADNGALAFSADGRRLAFSAWKSAKLWDLETGREGDSWTLPPGLGDCMVFEPGGKKLLLFRYETVDNKPPVQAFPWQEHRRVCRIRDLLGATREQPLKEIADFNAIVYDAVASDARCFVAEGFAGPDGKQRWIKAYDAGTGTTLWERNLTGTRPWPQTGALQADPTGKVVGYLADDAGSMALVETRTNKDIETWETMRTLGPGLGYSARYNQQPGAPLNGCSVFLRDGKHPVVTLGMGNWPTSVKASFDLTGNLLVYGNRDGTVYLCDLEAIRSRLNAKEVGLGW